MFRNRKVRTDTTLTDVSSQDCRFKKKYVSAALYTISFFRYTKNLPAFQIKLGKNIINKQIA